MIKIKQEWLLKEARKGLDQLQKGVLGWRWKRKWKREKEKSKEAWELKVVCSMLSFEPEDIKVGAAGQ